MIDPVDAKPSIDVRETLWRLRHYVWMGLLPIVALLCAGWVYLMVAEKIYESYATMSLNEQPRVSAALEPLVRADRDQERPANRTAELDSRIHSRPFLQSVARRMKLNENPGLLLEASRVAGSLGITPDEYALRKSASLIRQRIGVAPAPRTSYVRVSALDSNAAAALRLANAVADELVEESKMSALDRMRARGEFSEDQSSIYKEALRKSEDALQRYQESIIGRQLSNDPLNESNLETARKLVRNADAEIDEIRGRILSERNEWERRTAGPEGPPELQSTASLQLESRLKDLEASYGVALLNGPASPDAQALKDKIGATRQALFTEYQGVARNTSSIPDGASCDIAAGIALDRSEIRSLRQKRERLNGYVTMHLRGLESSPREQMELERLKGEVETNRNLLHTLEKEATSSQISEAMESSALGPRVEIIESPQLPLTPVSPKEVRVLLGALLLGALLAFGLVLSYERFHGAVRTVEETERELGVNVIGTMPRVEGWSRPGSFLQNHWAPVSLVAVVVATLAFYALHQTVLSDHGPDRTDTEQHR